MHLAGHGSGAYAPSGLRRSKNFFFHFPARERLGIFPHWFGAPPGSYFERNWVRSGGLAYTSMAYTSCLARLAILAHSGRTSVGIASGHVPVRRFLPPVAISTRFDASFGGAVLRRARHASPARPQAVRLPRLSAEGVRDGARPDFRASAAHHAPAPEARCLVPSLVVLRCCVFHANCLRRLPRSGPRARAGSLCSPGPRAISLATWLILPVAYACLKD